MSVANVMFETTNQPGGVAKAFNTSTVILTLAANSKGYTVFGLTQITAVATLTALTFPSVIAVASGGVLMCVSPSATTSVWLMANTAAASVPSFVGLIS